MSESSGGSVRCVPELQGRVLARVLAENMTDNVDTTMKTKNCGSGCDEVVNDSWKLADDQL